MKYGSDLLRCTDKLPWADRNFWGEGTRSTSEHTSEGEQAYKHAQAPTWPHLFAQSEGIPSVGLSKLQTPGVLQFPHSFTSIVEKGPGQQFPCKFCKFEDISHPTSQTHGWFVAA